MSIRLAHGTYRPSTARRVLAQARKLYQAHLAKEAEKERKAA